MDTMKTAIYARVSTADQSCGMHHRERRDYSEHRDLELVAHHCAKERNRAYEHIAF